MPYDSFKSRDFEIERYGTPDAAYEALVTTHHIKAATARAAVDSPNAAQGTWTAVNGTNGRLSVRREGGQWQIRVRGGIIPPRPGR